MKLSYPAPELVLLIDLPRFPKSAWEWLPPLQSIADAMLIRAKGEPQQTLIAAVERVRTLAPRSPIWVNGPLEVARDMGADGLHLPADADGAEYVRRDWPGYLTASAHSTDEARRHRGADCLVWGHAFATRSKPGLLPRTTLKDVLDAAPQPVLAIGGINTATVEQLQGSGLAGVVVADGVWLQGNPLQAAEDIKNIVATARWKGGRKGAMGCS
ncbi:thiamine phosphate synthase [Sulfobacillus harzensis]|uniref:Thiamine phosphate synthase n=1 Tax=Sulfobacillus harzensis TaxID=2729629 RepID=A0A7Y0L6P6_9FIRM|nr:thiamine phosphate synthase [Sulfobacillus harzensis]NMP24282.1 thiamine phosphate synthase [Sulfobacillus harzensis]